MNGFDIAIHAGTNLEKSLPFQAISRVKIRAIVLVPSPMVTLMEDKIDKWLILLLSRPVSDDVLVSHNAKKRIGVIALTSKNAVMDKNVWKNVGEGIYSIVLALPEIFF